MRKQIFKYIIFFILIIIVFSILGCQSVEFQLTRAMTLDRPVVLYFYDKNCHESTRALKIVKEAYKGKVDFVLIDIENIKNVKIVIEYEADETPEYRFLNAEKEKVYGYGIGFGREYLSHSKLANACDILIEKPDIGIIGFHERLFGPIKRLKIDWEKYGK